MSSFRRESDENISTTFTVSQSWTVAVLASILHRQTDNTVGERSDLTCSPTSYYLLQFNSALHTIYNQHPTSTSNKPQMYQSCHISGGSSVIHSRCSGFLVLHIPILSPDLHEGLLVVNNIFETFQRTRRVLKYLQDYSRTEGIEVSHKTL